MDKYTREEFDRAYSKIFEKIIENKDLERQKKAFVLGGQPGSGKSTFFDKNPEVANYYIINGDDYRQYHPHYIDIAKNDIHNMPQMTQKFSNEVIEKLIKDLSDKGYNIIVEGTLRNPQVPIRTCNELSDKGYQVNLVVVACDAELSWKSTIKRAEQMVQEGLFPRFVPIDIYNNVVNNISDNLEKIRDEKCFDTISIIDRAGDTLYPNERGLSPSETLKGKIGLDKWNAKLDIFIDDFEKRKNTILEKHLGKSNQTTNSKISFKDRLQAAKQKSKQLEASSDLSKTKNRQRNREI